MNLTAILVNLFIVCYSKILRKNELHWTTPRKVKEFQLYIFTIMQDREKLEQENICCFLLNKVVIIVII